MSYPFFQLLEAFFQPIDCAAARALWNVDSQTPQEILLAAALLSFNLSRGSVALDLNSLHTFIERFLIDQPNPEQAKELKQAIFNLQHFPFQNQNAIYCAQPNDSTPIHQPLVLWKNKLFFLRYFLAERHIENQLRQKLEKTSQKKCNELILNKLFKEDHEQKKACRTAFENHFCVITGGPGTGKTFTVARLLVLLFSDNPNLKIELAAPTGKAAQRLKESIEKSLGDLTRDFAPLIDKMHFSPQTIHRLLGASHQGFEHNIHHPLPCDVLILDEASMIDLLLFESILEALSPQTQLFLLGDQHQLASVDAGCLLGEICNENNPLLRQHTVELKTSFRFRQNSGIGQFARAVNEGKTNEIIGLFEKHNDLHLIQTPEQFHQLMAQFYENYAVAPPEKSADEAVLHDYALRLLKRNAQLQVLCALRHGDFGVKAYNSQIEKILKSQIQKKLEPERGNLPFFEQCPVMMTENLTQLGLSNGDLGVAIARWVDHQWQTRLVFAQHQHFFSPTRFSHCVEKMFALTIHKSQGSEFEHVVLVLPPQLMPILTRELLYTGITRAKKQLTLYIPQNMHQPFDLLTKIINHRLQRQSTLFENG